MTIIFSSVVDALGWALVHFLWQATVVALLAAGVLQLLRRRAASVRYFVAGGAFVLMLVVFGVTLVLHWPEPEQREVSGWVPMEPVEVAPVPLLRAEPGNEVIAVAPAIAPEGNRDTVSVPGTLLIEASGTEEAETVAPVSLEQRLREALPWMVALWAGGVVLCSFRLLWGWLRVKSWRRDGAMVEDAELVRRFDRLRRALGLSQPVKLLASRAVAVPVVIGWMKPVILLPVRLVAGLPMDQLEAILAHELAHVRRFDYLVNLVQNMVETLFFFHPAVWWMSAQLRKEREYCCDDIASQQCGGAVGYARALAALEELRGVAYPGVAASGGSLLERVQRLLGAPRQSRPGVSLAGGVPAALVLLSLVVFANPTQTEPGGDAQEDEKRRVEVKAEKLKESHGSSLEGVAPANTPAIRGFQVAGLPQWQGEVQHPTFELPACAKGGDPQIIYSLNREQFYLRYGETTYGPVKGNPFEELDLVGVLEAQIKGMEDAKKQYSRIWKMIDCQSDQNLLAAGYEVLLSFEKEFRYGGHGVRSVVRAELAKNPLAPTAPAGRKVVKHLFKIYHESVHDEAKKKWEAARLQVPDSAYHKGHPLAEAPRNINWGKPNTKGLRFGVLGLPVDKPFPIGRMLPLRFFIRNDGDEVVKCNPTGLWGVGVHLELIDEEGNSYLMDAMRSVRGGEPRVALAQGRFYECQFQPVQTIGLKADGQPATEKFEPCALVLGPGRYDVDLRYSMGVFDVSADLGADRFENGRRAPGEWNGTLMAAPMKVTFAPSVVTAFTKHQSTNHFDLHQLRFHENKIELRHRINWPVRKRIVGETYDEETGEWTGTPWGEVADSWEAKGAYRAAVEKGSARLWTADKQRIYYIEYHHKFHVRNSWPHEEAWGELGGMPDAVRKALKLPEKAKRAGADAGKRKFHLKPYAAGEGSLEYLAFLKAMREAHGLNAGDPDPIVWGKKVSGLQAGVVAPPSVKQTQRFKSWILLRNSSERMRKIEVAYSWNVLKFAAMDGQGKELGVADLFGKLWGIDAIHTVELKPGQHIELRTYDIAVTPGREAKEPLVKVLPATKEVRVRFDLRSVLQPNGGLWKIETGEAVLRVDPAPAAEKR